MNERTHNSFEIYKNNKNSNSNNSNPNEEFAADFDADFDAQIKNNVTLKNNNQQFDNNK